jgi:hypothetical protein
MAYIGRDISNLSDRAVLDNITASATATYNLTLNSVAYVPSSAESLTVSLNGIIQKPQSSYTVSNATIIFDSALTSSDSIDFIIAERSITLTGVGSGSVGTSQLVDGSVSNTKLENSSITLNGSAVSLGGSATIGGGKIGQVVATTKTSTFTTQSDSFVDVTGLSVNITPSATNSKILVRLSLMASINSATMYVRINGGNASSVIGDSGGGNRVSAFIGLGRQTSGFDISKSALSQVGELLDTPSTTSQITYQVQVRASDNYPRNIYVNRPPDDSDNVYVGRFVSTITAMEVLA